jgi:spore coat protein H
VESLRPFFRHAALFVGSALVLSGQALPPLIVPKPPAVNASPDALFAGVIPKLELTISQENLDKLAKNPRDYVTLSIKEPGLVDLEKCSVKLKGSAGSFRQITEDRPGFSLRTAKSKKGQEYRGLTKFQLNNCAQDGTMLLEMAAGEMARRAGVPASRCTHAYVVLNGKPLGTYVLKEGFNNEFLSYFFKDTKGHLYDGGFVNEIDGPIEVDQGDPDEKVRLTELIGAAKETRPALRLARMERILDVDAYFRHLALEQILCHWDGYSFNRNNYRFYEDPSTGRFHFILHGMDQVFGDNRWYVFRPPSSLVPNALLVDRAMRERYRTQFFAVYEKNFRTYDWPKRILELAANTKAKLTPFDVEEAKRFDQRGKEAAERVKQRLDSIRVQLEDSAQLRSMGGKATLAKYAWERNADEKEADETDVDGRSCFHVKSGLNKGGDFRLPFATGPGRYRLTCMVKTTGVIAGKDEKDKGLRLRISGLNGVPALTGTNGWRTVSVEFSVAEADPVLVLELRAEAGHAWFDRNSLTLTRIP